jgi:hypothetical protein
VCRSVTAKGIPVADYVRLFRGSSYSGGGANLGFFTHRGKAIFGADYVEVDLPEGIERASGYLENVTPSLTAVAIQFEVADKARSVLSDSLRADYRTGLQATSRGWVYRTPENQRREAMLAAVDGLTRECADWLGRHFPGAFASGLLEAGRPSCVFVTTRRTIPLARPSSFTTWLWLTGLDRYHDTWESRAWPGLRLRVPEGEHDESRWWLAGRRGDFLNDPSDRIQQAYGGRSRSGWLNRIRDEMCSILMLHATESLLLGMQRQVARSRDSTSATASRAASDLRLRALAEDVNTFVRDIDPIAMELSGERWRTFERARFVPSSMHILRSLPEVDTKARRHDVLRRHPRLVLLRLLPAVIARRLEAPRDADPPPTLTKYLAEQIRDRATRLLEAERQHREALSTASTLLAAAETMTLDRRLLLLTVVLVLLTVVLAALALVTAAPTFWTGVVEDREMFLWRQPLRTLAILRSTRPF